MAAVVDAPDAVIKMVVVVRDVAARADAVPNVALYDSFIDFIVKIEYSLSSLVFI